MQRVEFNATIDNGVIHIPQQYINNNNIDNKKYKISILNIEDNTFNPKEFCGAGNASKQEIDTYLQINRTDWDNS
jgi:hypothetical protein